MSAASSNENPSNSSPAISTDVLVETPLEIRALSLSASTLVKSDILATLLRLELELLREKEIEFSILKEFVLLKKIEILILHLL